MTSSLSLLVLGVSAGEIQQIRINADTTGTRAEIQLAGNGGYKTLALSGPNRLVVDFPDCSAVRGMELPASAGVVAAVRTGQPIPGTFRVVFDLDSAIAPLKPQMHSVGAVSTLVIQWPGQARSAAAVQAASSNGREDPIPQQAEAASDAVAAASTQPAIPALTVQAPRTVSPVDADQSADTSVHSNSMDATDATMAASGLTPAVILNGHSGAMATATAPPRLSSAPLAQVSGAFDTEADAGADAAPPPRPVMPSAASHLKMAAGMRPLIVAIDPGHGGQDPGATGPTGKHEKDVTLAVGRELARQVDATPGMKAYMTRNSDVFIPLPMRAQKARAAKADIFISIHADAAENRSASGATVYVLSTKGASSQRARWLADKENAADLIGGVRLRQTESTLAGVLLDLAQSGHMKASEDAAGQVLSGLDRVGNNHKPHLERANFAVLRTSDMPAMLVETAYISNPTEEQQLIDPSYQRKLASAILQGVNAFFTRQPPPGTLFAARAQVEADAAAGTVAGGSR